jgi:hypothetical protein
VGVGLSAGLLLPRKRIRSGNFVVGFPSEWESFAARNPELLKAMPLLFDTMELVFDRAASIPAQCQ